MIKYEVEYFAWEYGLPRAEPKMFFTFVEANNEKEAIKIVENSGFRIKVMNIVEVNEDNIGQ